MDVEFNLDKLEPNKDLQAKIKVRNKGDKEEPVLTIIALFNSENKMLNFSYLSKVIRIGTDEELSAGFSLSPDIKDNSGNEVRVFVWKGEDLESSSMVPLSNVIILK